MNSTMKWTMISLALGAFGAIGCSSSTTCDDAGNNCTSTSTGGATSTGGSTGATTSSSSTGGSTGGTTTGGTTGGTTTGGTTTGSSTGGTTTGSSTGGTTGGGEYFDAGSNCWQNPATSDHILNGCTSAQGVDLGVSLLPCWDGGVTAPTSSTIYDGFPAPKLVSGWTCQ